MSVLKFKLTGREKKDDVRHGEAGRTAEREPEGKYDKHSTEKVRRSHR